MLPINEFKTTIVEFEELDDIRLYYEAKKSDEPSIPIDEAFRNIEMNRKAK